MVLTKLSDTPICTYERGNVKVFSKLDTREPKQAILSNTSGCCMAIYTDFQKAEDVWVNEKLQKVQGLFFKQIQDTKHRFSDCYAEMTILLTDFVNPLSNKYSKLEYIELYIRLLAQIGLPVELSSITTTQVTIVIDYSKIAYNEVCLLKLSWQTIRSLHVSFVAHIPARFIELVELYPEKDLFLLLQIAFRLVPGETIMNAAGSYGMANSNPVYQKSDSTSMLFQPINPALNINNYRDKLLKSDNLTYILRPKPEDQGIIFTESEYKVQYDRLVESTTKEELWTNIENSILKNQKLTKKQ